MASPSRTINLMALAARASEAPECTTAVPDQYGYVPPAACNSYYNFYPSFEGNLAFAVLFGSSTLAHLIQAIVYKKRFCWVILMGGVWETVAFSLRTAGAHAQQNLMYAVWGQLLFLLAPLWVNAFAYMTVARLVYFGLPEKKICGVRADRLTVIFVWLDVTCFLIQGAGGSMLSNNDDANLMKIGKSVYMAGIGVQMGFVLIFAAMTGYFYLLLHQQTGGVKGWMRLLIWTMLAVLAFIVMRIVFRLIEFGAGVESNNPLVGKEIYPFMLDAFPMVLALVLLNVIHPGLVLHGPDSEFPRKTRVEKKALKIQKKEEKRQRKMVKKDKSHKGFELTGSISGRSDVEGSGGDRSTMV